MVKLLAPERHCKIALAADNQVLNLSNKATEQTLAYIPMVGVSA
jgi:hypothetical protein